MRCVYCGGATPIKDSPGAGVVNYRTQDHIIPKACGGGRFMENLLPACFACNSARNHKWPPSDRAHPDFRDMVRAKEDVLNRTPLSPEARRWLDKVRAEAAKRRHLEAWKAVDAMTPGVSD